MYKTNEEKVPATVTPGTFQTTVAAEACSPSDISRVASNPVSNTGLKSQPEFQVAVDWLDISFRKVPDTKDLYEIIDEFEQLTGDVIDFSPTRACFNGRQWDGSGRGEIGTLLWYDSCDRTDRTSDEWPQLKIAMSGKVLAHVDQAKLAEWLVSRAALNELDCTRIDLALDDRDKFVELREIIEAKALGNFFNASYSSYIESGNRGKPSGVTVYFGSPSSSKRLRVYDKTIESGGRILGNRWEAEFRKKAARETLYQWLENIDDGIQKAARWAQNIVMGVIDFRDRSCGDANRSRCPQLNWYKRLIRKLHANPARIRVAAVIQTVQRSIDWITAAVTPSLASIKAVLGEDFQPFIDNAINAGGERLSNIRRKIIERANIDELCY